MNEKLDLKYFLHTIIVIFFMIGFGRIFKIDGVTSAGMQILGIFLGLVWGWSFIEMGWPSLLGIFSLGLSVYMSMTEALKAGFGDNCVLLVFFCLIFAAYLDSTGINRVIANWFISRKVCYGRPWIFTLMLLLMAYVLGATVILFAAIVLSWSLFYSICEMTDIKPGEPYAVAMVIGLCYAACLGVSILAFKPLPIIVYSIVETYLGVTVNYLKFAVITAAISLTCLLLYWLLLRFLFHIDISKLKDKIEMVSKQEKEAVNREQRMAGFLLCLFFVMLFIPGLLNEESFVKVIFQKITTTGTAALICIIACMLKLDGNHLANFGALAKDGVVWDLILVFAAIMPVSTAIADPETGLLNKVVEIADNIFINMSPLLFSIVLVALVAVCSQVLYNVVVATIFSPILCIYAEKFGASPEVLAVLICFAMAMALCTPAASGMAAMMYGNKKWLTNKQVIHYTSILFMIDLVVVVAVGIPVASSII